MTTYTIRVELEARPTADALDELVDALTGYHPAAAPNGQRTDVVISLPADSLSQAVRTALAVIADATTAAARAVQAMPSDDWDTRVGMAPAPDLVSVTEAAELAGVSRQAILQRLESGSLRGQKVGTAWVVEREGLDQITARLVTRDGKVVARGVRVTAGEPHLHTDGVTYVPAGTSHSVGGGPRVHTYVPQK